MEFSGKRGGAGWRVMAALAGLVAVLIAYFWVHKPLDPALIGSLGGAALDILAASLVVVAAGGLGRRILTLLDLSGVSRAERVGLEGALGLGVLGIIALIVGLVGLYNGLVFWILLVICAVVCIRGVLGWCGDVVALFRFALSTEAGWSRLLMIITLFLLFMALLHALAPPTAFDAINYHLVGPSRYLDAGRIAAQSDNHFLGFPQGMEILYGVVMGLFGRETAAAPLHWMIGLLGLLAVAGLVRRFTNIVTGWLAVTLLLGAFSIWLLFGWPYIDLGVMTYGAVALVAAVQWRDLLPSLRSGEAAAGVGVGMMTRWLILMGIFGGLALGVK
ncbi:MAG: hypothetical protein K8I30_06730, partial [Anaerolineae bacterium]|nr:hypothetical protein [Anaerolineae bacterium]